MKYILTIYIIGFIITFGAAWNHNPYHENDQALAESRNFAAGLGCATAWPLYWSYRIFEK